MTPTQRSSVVIASSMSPMGSTAVKLCEDLVMVQLFTRYDLRKSRAARLWRPEDGDFEQFAAAHLARDQQTRDALFERLELVFESVDGHFVEMARDLGRQVDLDLGPIHPFDEILNAWSPAAHVDDDLFANKLAFIVLLNFPLTTLEERLAEGEQLTRRQWAEARLAQRFSRRVPAEASQAMARARAAAAQYVSTYDVEVGSKRLLAHWNLRDEIKALYSEGASALPQQRLIAGLMEQVVDDTLRPGRYALILDCFHAAQLVDKYSPTAPTLIERRFNENRALPEARVQAMLEQILGSPLVARVAALIEQRLQRPLEPFDIWYNGFRANAAYTDAQLSEITRRRYANAAAFATDMPRMLEQLGF